jgi:hypothetical protein
MLSLKSEDDDETSKLGVVEDDDLRPIGLVRDDLLARLSVVTKSTPYCMMESCT